MSFLLPEEDDLLPKLDPLDPRLRTSRVGFADPGETSRADKPAGMEGDIPGSDRDWRQAAPFTPPKRSRYDLAMEKVDQVLSERPTRTAPNFWQKLAAAGLGASAGFVNAGRRTHIDPTAAIQGVTGETGFQQRTADWKQRLETTGQQAQIEASKVAAQRQAEADARTGRVAESTITKNNADAALKLRKSTDPLKPVPPIDHNPAHDMFVPDANEPSGYRKVVPGVTPPIRPLVTPPGATIRDAKDPGKIIATNDPKEVPDKNPQRLQLRADSLDASDPDKQSRAKAILAAEDAADIQKIRAGAETRRDVANTPSAPIEHGSREFKIAQDLAYGKLTMQQFRSMTAYSRDTNKKMDIYNKAGELNPNFNPASFEMGFTLAKNPKVQQQLASMDNVQAGIPDLLRHSDAAARSGITALNKVIIPGGIALGGKTYSNLHTARLGFADELSGALGFGSATDMSRQLGLDMTNEKLSPENLSSAIREVVEPFVMRKRSTLLKQMGIYGQPGMNPAAGPQGGNPNPTGYVAGHVYGGLTYLGGDPNNQASWKK